MKHFRNIEELPIWNYTKVNETGDLRYLLCLDDYYDLPNVSDLKQFETLWEDIRYQIIDEFGFSHLEQLILQKDKEIEQLKIKLILKKDKKLLTKLKIRQKELVSMLKSNKSEKKQSFEEQVVYLESYFKIPIDIKKMSVKRYFTYIRVFEQQIEQQKRENKKKK